MSIFLPWLGRLHLCVVAVSYNLHFFECHHSFINHIVQCRQKRLYLLLGVNYLDYDRQILGKAQYF